MAYEITSFTLRTLPSSSVPKGPDQLAAVAELVHDSGVVLTVSRLVNKEIAWVVDAMSGSPKAFSEAPGSRDRVTRRLKASSAPVAELDARLKQACST